MVGLRARWRPSYIGGFPETPSEGTRVMDAFTPDPPDTPTPHGVRFKTSGAVRPPDASDGDIDESSSVADIIDYGCQALEMGGRGSRVEWLWRRRGLKALHHLRLKKLRSKEFADAAESFGIESRSEAFKLAHIWSRIGDVDSWAAAKVNESLRRRGIEKWPSNNAILAEFPSPKKKSPLSQEERDAKKAEEDAARARAKAKRNSVGGDGAGSGRPAGAAGKGAARP